MNGVPLDKKHLEEGLLTELIPNSDGRLVDLVCDRLPSLKTESFSLLDKRSMGATVAKHLNYIVGGKDPDKLRMVTIWVVADLDTELSREGQGQGRVRDCKSR